MIFVEQRQVASTLSKTLLAIPETSGKLRTAYLVGEGVNSEGVARESDRVRGDPVTLFREGQLNVRKLYWIIIYESSFNSHI